jgi:hypothetical protein
MRSLLLSALLTVGLCGQPRPFDPEIEVRLDDPFALRMEQTAEVAGTPLRLRFEEVLEDSRCPADVMCVWAGNARIRLIVEATTEPAELLLNTGLEPRAAPAAGYLVTLEAVQPATRSDRAIQPEDYIATLRVSSSN